MGKKLMGALPKNQAVDYKAPKRPKVMEIEAAEDGGFVLSCRGGNTEDPWMGTKKTAQDLASLKAKVEEYFGSKKGA